MHRLERLVLCNWGRLAPQDIPVRGVTAILGPTGAGKSTIVDAIQLIVTGSNSRYYDLNKSTGGQNARSIKDYCLGADDHVDPDAPERDRADSLIAMAFRDQTTGKAVSIGVIYSASRDEPQAAVRWRFIAPDYAISIEDLIELRGPGQLVIPQAARVLEILKARCPAIRLPSSAIGYVDEYLHLMRPKGSAPHSAQVLRNFKESIAFQPISDPTEFVRKHILEEDYIEVEALRGSIERYRFLEGEVQRRQQQLEEIAEARKKYQLWGQHRIRMNQRAFMAAHAETQRFGIEIERLGGQHREAEEGLAREERQKAHHDLAIAALNDDIIRARTLLAESGEAAQIRGLDIELEAARDKKTSAVVMAQKRLALLAKLGALIDHADKVPLSMQDALASVASLIETARGRNPDTLPAIDDRLAALERAILRLVGADESFARQIEALDDQVAQERSRLNALEGSLQGEKDGRLLSSPVQQFQRLLQDHGISSRALPDLVEVSDPNWAIALEMLLGPNREALIVPRADVREAFRLLYENRRQLSRCRLVDTRKTGHWGRRMPSDSIAGLIVTDDEDARAFIEHQVGRVSMAQSDADLEHLERAVTRRGKSTAGMAMRVYEDLIPILGKTAQKRALSAAREEFETLSISHRRTRTARDALQSARTVIAALREAPADELVQALDRLAEATASVRGATTARAQVASPENRKIQAEIDGFKDEILRYKLEVRDDIEPEIKRLTELKIGLQQKAVMAREAVTKQAAIAAEAEAAETQEPLAKLLELLSDEDRIETLRLRVDTAVEFAPPERDVAALLADMVTEARADAANLPRLAEDNLRRARNLYVNFVQTHLGQSPLNDPDDVTVFQWCATREHVLEHDELRQYREQFQDARRQMEADLTEGLINRLSDKFQKAKQQIARLNRSLEGRTFTGQTYIFRSRVNEAMKPIHVLAEAIAEAPDRGLAILDDEDLDPRIRKGFRDLEQRLHDDDLVKDLRDYRKFYDFELHMRNDRGQETTLSKRSATGSGGQKQAPYYIAVGAAMAAAYFPKSATPDPDGFSLVVFDEAFNNLDAPNTRALIDFFGDLNLQVVVAAPDKVRATFLETADTIISVNRRPDTQEPVITVVHPSRKARDALARANPVHLGVEHFRTPVEVAAE